MLLGLHLDQENTVKARIKEKVIDQSLSFYN